MTLPFLALSERQLLAEFNLPQLSQFGPKQPVGKNIFAKSRPGLFAISQASSWSPENEFVHSSSLACHHDRQTFCQCIKHSSDPGGLPQFPMHSQPDWHPRN